MVANMQNYLGPGGPGRTGGIGGTGGPVVLSLWMRIFSITFISVSFLWNQIVWMWIQIEWNLNVDDYPAENSNSNNRLTTTNSSVLVTPVLKKDLWQKSLDIGEYIGTSSWTTTWVNSFSIVQKFDCKAVNLNCTADSKSPNYIH